MVEELQELSKEKLRETLGGVLNRLAKGELDAKDEFLNLLKEAWNQYGEEVTKITLPYMMRFGEIACRKGSNPAMFYKNGKNC